MKEIKFRSWDRLNNKMKPVYALEFEYNFVKTEETNGDDNSFKNQETDRHVLMQYTGYEDNNDKELYEGDIIQIRSGHYHMGVWEFEGVEVVEDIRCVLNHIGYGEKFNIIGNIYENPELAPEEDEGAEWDIS